MRQIRFGVVIIASIVVWGCSAAPPGPVERSNDESKTPTSKESKTPSSTNETPSGSSSTPPPPATPGTCSAAQGADACYACCEEQNPGADIAAEVWFDCACQPTVCGTQCAQTVCSDDPTDPADGDACATCLETTAAQCDAQAEAACAADAGCTAAMQCMEASQCESAEDDGEDDEEDED